MENRNYSELEFVKIKDNTLLSVIKINVKGIAIPNMVLYLPEGIT